MPAHVRRWTSTKLFALHTIAALMLFGSVVVPADKLTALIGGLTALYVAYAAGNTVAGAIGPKDGA